MHLLKEEELSNFFSYTCISWQEQDNFQ